MPEPGSVRNKPLIIFLYQKVCRYSWLCGDSYVFLILTFCISYSLQLWESVWFMGLILFTKNSSENAKETNRPKIKFFENATT
jgi:hypothetical protein